jgi:hypothetical protein
LQLSIFDLEQLARKRAFQKSEIGNRKSKMNIEARGLLSR